MTEDKKRLITNGFLALLIINSILIVMLFLNTNKTSCYREQLAINLKNREKHLKYIKKCTDPPLIPSSIIKLKCLNKPDLEKSAILIIVLPTQFCTACLSSLFNDILLSNIKKKNVFLFTEESSIILERQWHSMGYQAQNILTDTIFSKQNYQQQGIIIIKSDSLQREFKLLQYEDYLGDICKPFLNN